MTMLYANVKNSVPGSVLNLQINAISMQVSGDGNAFIYQGPVGQAYTVTILNDGAAMVCQGSNLTGTLAAPATYAYFTCHRQMSFSNNPNASWLVGQTGFTTATAAAGQTGLRGPKGVAGSNDGGTLFIADTANARVVGVDLPDPNNHAYDFSVGTQTSLTTPRAVDLSTTKTVIVDSGNNEVYLYNTVLAGDDAPDVTLGGSPTHCYPYSMSQPSGAALTASMLAVADTANNRVLIFNPVPTPSGASANIALGQLSLYTCTHRTPVGSNTMYGPQDVWTDGNKIIVADTGNNRVLIWNTIPGSSGQNADVVLGQAGFGGSAANTTSVTLSAPYGVVSDGNSIFVADSGNSRVLSFPFTGANGRAATLVFGQSSFTGGSANAGGSMPTAHSLSVPKDVTFAGTALVVADENNNRVVAFESN